MIETFAPFHFLRPSWLWLLPIVFAIWWLWHRSNDDLQGWRVQMDHDLLEALVVGANDQLNWRSYGLLAGWLLATIAIAGPTWRLEPSPFAADAQPLMILLKADASMQLTPPAPSRLERAQLKIADLAEARKGQPLGLIAYAGSAHLVLPPTRDTDIVAKMATEISPAVMPEAGDRLDSAIRLATNLLAEGEEGGAILVVTDTAGIDTNRVTTQDDSMPSFPIQFLSLVGEGSPEQVSVERAGKALRGTVQSFTVDDTDIMNIVAFAEKRATSGVAGQSSRWQEAGYWITPLIAVIVAFSFRRQKSVTAEKLS